MSGFDRKLKRGKRKPPVRFGRIVHTISTAAVLLNWHARISGASTAMRPGLAEDDPRKAGADA